MRNHWAHSCSPKSFQPFLLSQLKVHWLFRNLPFVLFWKAQTAKQINPIVTHLCSFYLEKSTKGLLLGYCGALGCWSAGCRRPRSKSPATACSSTSRSRWQSGTACRGSRRGRSSLGEGEGGVKDQLPCCTEMLHLLKCWEGVYST